MPEGSFWISFGCQYHELRQIQQSSDRDGVYFWSLCIPSQTALYRLISGEIIFLFSRTWVRLKAGLRILSLSLIHI